MTSRFVHNLAKAACVAYVLSACMLTLGLRAAEPNAVAGEILVDGCRIKLIDEVTLAADRPGTLKFVEAKEGDMVEAGQEVARLKDDVAAARYEIARKTTENDVAVRYATKASEVALAEYEGALEANRLTPGTFSNIEIRKYKLAAERGVLEVEQAEHEFQINELSRDEAQAELTMYRIEAPFAGIVTRVVKSTGEAVRQGDPVLQLVSTRRVKVEGYVSIEDGLTIRPGASVHVQLDVPDAELAVENEVFEGKIVFVDVAVQPVTRQIRVWAEVSNRDNILRSGLSATMRIRRGEHLTSADPAQDAARTPASDQTGR